MSSKISQTEATLRVTRLIRAPRERVFAAWTTPADITKWLGPDTCQVLSAKIDLRVGGEYRFKVKTEERGEIEVSGVYKEVKRPSKLVYTWAWSGNPEMNMGETLVTVEFVDKNGGTEIQLTHERFSDSETRDQHEYGWNGSLDKLARLVCSGPSLKEFGWNELVTNDVAGAAKFYTGLFGWQAEDFPGSDIGYKLFKNNGNPVGGLMKCPKGEAPPIWLAYVMVESVDGSVDSATKLGGGVLVPAFDVPNVGRIAVLKDPQGACFGIFQPKMK